MTQLADTSTTDAPARPRARAGFSLFGSKPQARHYRIGPVPVSLSSVLPGVGDDFHKLYRTYAVQAPIGDEFAIEVIAKRSPRSLRRYYHVVANGERLFSMRNENEVLPHVEWAINTMVATRLSQYLQIHASVVARNGVAIICPGQPGQGKTTLAAALLKQGWSYLSDEFALFDPETQLLEPYPKALCVKAGSFDALRRMRLPIDTNRVYYKGEKGQVAMLDPLKIRPDVVAGRCRVGMIVFPEVNHSTTPVIERVSQAQTVFELTRCSFNFGRFRAPGFHMLADVVERAGCYRLRCGHLGTTCDLVEAFFTREGGVEE
jgi:HprK-related kinase A